MITVPEIKSLKDYYINELYSKTRREQGTDQSYRDDVFSVPEIKPPHHIYRSGMGSRMVDSPAEQIITSNPQVFTNKITGKTESAQNIARLLNEQWTPILRLQNPNPFKEFVKNLLCRGEAYIQLSHNESWVTGRRERSGLPVFFIVPDPMNIYGSPDENEVGIPNNVIVSYSRQANEVIAQYPDFKNIKNNKKVDWLEYWDNEVRYFEANGEPVLKGELQENLYGFVPFIRKYSGFGRRSADGELSSLVVGDLRFSRDLLREECVLRSNYVSQTTLFAHRPYILRIPADAEFDEKSFKQEFVIGAYQAIVLSLPKGATDEWAEVPAPSEQILNRLNAVRIEIAQRCPFVLSGFPIGESGRQQDISQTAAGRRYDTVLENTENAYSTAFSKAVSICQSIPTLSPFNKEDLKGIVNYEVKLRASDPIEEDRKQTLGSRLFAQKEISLKKNLMDFKGYTEDEAEDEITNILAEQVTIFNPEIAAVIGEVAAREMGMEKYLEEVQQRRMNLEAQQKGLQEPLPPTAQRRAEGEVRTPLGRELLSESLVTKGQRRPPEAYYRGR